MEAESVRCERHGDREATFVCRHLLEGQAKGWVTLDSGASEHPDAICDDCDRAWRSAGDELTEDLKALMSIKIVCAGCYEELRAKQSVA